LPAHPPFQRRIARCFFRIQRLQEVASQVIDFSAGLHLRCRRHDRRPARGWLKSRVQAVEDGRSRRGNRERETRAGAGQSSALQWKMNKKHCGVTMGRTRP
jgi:hypothetical protein